MSYNRNIILKKEIDNNIQGFFILEQSHKNPKKDYTMIQVAEGVKGHRNVKRLNKETLKGLKADELIDKYIKEGYRVIKDSTSETNKERSGFRIIDNLTNQIEYNYNY